MSDDRLRIDKWLWFARLAKTRTAAQKLAVSGRVRVNRKKNLNSAQLVKVGDVLTVAFDSAVKVLRIEAMAMRRGPAPEARLLYTDLSPPQPTETAQARASGNARPTKRQRRALENFRNGFTGRSDFSPEPD